MEYYRVLFLDFCNIDAEFRETEQSIKEEKKNHQVTKKKKWKLKCKSPKLTRHC